MKYEKVRKNAPQLLSLTSLSVSEFDALLPSFKYHWDEYYSRYTLEGKLRERISYGRITGKLPMIGDKLLFILSYLKNNPLQEYHGATYGMSQPQCNEWIHLLSDILFKTLKSLGELPDRNSLRIEPAAKMFCSTVLSVPYRDRWTTTDKNPVTAVKKTHNVKNNLLCNDQKRILWLSETFDDKKITDEQPYVFPPA